MGRAISRRLLDDGLRVAIADLEAGAQVEDERTLGVDVDVTEPESARAIHDAVLDRFGRVDALVNSAGIAGPTAPVSDGVLVNCLVPGVIDAGLTHHTATEEERALFTSRVPMGRMGTPEEVAELVSWLASPQCSFSTGAGFDLSGGRAAY